MLLPRLEHKILYAAVLLAMAVLLAPRPALAQDAGSTEVQDGTLQGRVSDNETSEPVDGVTVTVIGPKHPDAEPRRVVRTTNAEGLFELRNVPIGSYEIRFEKDGYPPSKLPELVVGPDQIVRADLRILPRPAGEVAPAPPPGAAPGPGPAPDVEEFVVLAPPLAEIMAASRMDADELINTLSAEDFSKFAASDVADALKFVPGVNVVEGQFAIIRGLEDRYNSTLYNSASVPSPDPDSQSVQLDLFAADIVSNLVVSKTFSPGVPSNSSGGAINVITHDYPEEFELKLSSSTGFNSYAWDRYLEFEKSSPVGIEEDGWSAIEREFGLSLGGRRELFDRELRFKGVLNREIDFETAEGYDEKRQPAPADFRRFPRPGRVVESGDMSLGQLSLSGGEFDFTQSEKSTQNTAYAGLGFDADSEGDHKLDGSFFWTKKKQDIVQLLANGHYPSFDYDTLRAFGASGDFVKLDELGEFSTPSSTIFSALRTRVADPVSRGAAWFDDISDSSSFSTERKLWVAQLNGDHRLDAMLEGLHASWATNKAKTTQTESAIGATYFYEPFDLTIPESTRFPLSVEELGPGLYYANNGIYANTNDISEKQYFGRFDVDYERDLLDELRLRVGSGFWYEHAKREVGSSFLESPTVEGAGTQFAIPGETPLALGRSLLDSLNQDPDGSGPAGFRDATSDGDRKIRAYYFDGKLTLFDKVDLLGGVRLERLRIASKNDPFVEGQTLFDGSPVIFPSKYVFFDRQDNAANGESVPPDRPENFTYNDQLLGLDLPVDPATGFVDLLDRASLDALVNGLIDEDRVFPSAGFTFRPIEGFNFRGAFSETVARPSFRELGYYVSVEPATDDLVVGNPQLQLSDVRSWDLRGEYVWGDLGDLVAVSGFRKRIGTPIESIIIRDQANFEGGSSGYYRTFFNNPDTGKLWGIEAEARKSFDFIPYDLFRYLSIGGNFTYIWAKVGRTDAELQRSEPFFGVADGDSALFVELESTRRLFDQPKWIANTDLSFDHPDWGTKFTLSFFAISDVLDAIGSVAIRPNGEVFAYVPDRYVDSYRQMDLTASQTFSLGVIPGDLTAKLGIKNLTNSTRKLIYDTTQTDQEYTQRSVRIGLDYTFGITYSFRF